MDFIYGQTLEDVILNRGKIPEKEVKEWFYQIADVIKYLHSREPKIIFRDLKPSNVMLTSDNEIKLIDFGIARTLKMRNLQIQRTMYLKVSHHRNNMVLVNQMKDLIFILLGH